ncbi:unnamed protein product [Medioppia subpectinata]|uniref:Uncharacterized protein n=1 Tax=Medioppia subpectinata TaxID=1979941 RepID=A0A7R9QC10_9ACAR|nr:unnamed protein product [Medioppia subpectinata]CAG2117499.1 unnamed protein product [Medioppia subpectinata]
MNLISIASYFVLLTRSCVEQDFSQLEYIEICGTIVGTIVCIVSFFNVAEKLYDYSQSPSLPVYNE